MSNTGDIPIAPAPPLNARSLALSALLGTHPPTLSARALVALAVVFEINAGTMRTALSRMVSAGDVTARDGSYTLTERLLQRQAAQDAGRSLPATGWDGDWHVATASVDHRDLTARRQVRAVMANARFGELRPSVWLRPANLPVPRLDHDWLVVTGPARGTPDDLLAARLWDLPAIAHIAATLVDRIDRLEANLDRDDRRSIPAAFSLSAEVVRFLRTEPLLPGALVPADWPVDDLRRRYDDLERDVRAMLRPILVEQG